MWFFLNHWNQRVGMCIWGWYSIKERKVPEGFYVVHYLKPNNGYVKHISLFQGEKVQVNLKQGFFLVIREVKIANDFSQNVVLHKAKLHLATNMINHYQPKLKLRSHPWIPSPLKAPWFRWGAERIEVAVRPGAPEHSYSSSKYHFKCLFKLKG